MKKIISFLMLILSLQLHAQFHNPVVVEQNVAVNGNEGVITFSATIEQGWHMYSTNIPDGGPTAATITIESAEGVEPVGALTPGTGEISAFDPMFEMDVKYFENTAVFTQKFKITAREYHLQGFLEYGACNDENCMPPTAFDFDVKGTADIKPVAKDVEVKKEQQPTKAVVEVKKEKKQEVKAEPAKNIETSQQTSQAEADKVVAVENAPSADNAVAENVGNNSLVNKLWTPVIDKLEKFQSTGDSGSRSVWLTFLLGFGGGLLALLTPCVWPIIPMTMSFFLKRSKSRKKALSEAVFYGLSIVIIYLTLGLLVTAIFGASALNALSTNAVFNIFFCLLLLLFGASFLGGFEITLPSSWTNKVDEKAGNTTGYVSIFLMAFTLALVSFSCTGPIIGFLLVEVTTSGSIFGPAVGMLGFALALALPFTFFAIFPSLLKQAPRSGSWMNTIKVVLGFIELAFALKFFSVADLAYGWRLLDRETFLAIWIVLFTLLGLYLLNIIRFPHDDTEEKTTSIPKFFLSLISLAFAVYMIPGLWGAPCKAVSAFAPPMWTQDFKLGDNEIHPASYDYEEGMEIARRQGKPVLVDFTGHGCVNCREMEAAVWTDDRVIDMLRNDYVLISLYVDDKTPLDEAITIEEQGVVRKLRTVGDKWSYLQRYKFGANAQPFYIPVDNDGNPLNGSYSYDKSVDSYIKFLKDGLNNYRNR